ncbi:tetratricopeptide repeat protein [Maridesulfovibrio zosterae]|uniref:tetratricopeptide repeat protein n=1 Tax=Maridesulfovibrio zosterae TaxID=82171 RepID=UPI00040D524A|nr:tetratricopeptide repeat protein [Maridesulfovibrio zosterae]
MNIKIWRVLFFVLIIVGSTVLIYPFPRDMVPLYLKNGDIQKASEILTRLLEEDPDDLELLSLGADVYTYRGLPRKAIASLERLLKHKPDNKEALDKLVLLYEWDVMPQEAMQTWERIANIRVKESNPLQKLVMYYRYFGMLPEEVAAIIRLNKLQGEKSFISLFLTELRKTVDLLAVEHEQDPQNQHLSYLIRQIFVVGEQFRNALEQKDKINQIEYVTYVLENFVAMGRSADGYNYALRMDEENGKSIVNRLRLATVLGWFQQYETALAILNDLEKIVPDNVVLAKETVELARSAGRLDLAEAALEKLVTLEPDNEEHHANLGQIYMETGNHRKAVTMFRKLAAKFNNWVKYAHDMLRAALYSSDKQLMAEVISNTADVNISDSEYLRTKADVLLSLDRPLEAYPVLKSITESNGATVIDYERLVDAAIASKEKKLVTDTIDIALKFSPGNVKLMRKAGEAWLASGDPAKAYEFYRQVASKEVQETDILNMILAASDTQNLKLTREAARYAEKLAPKNIKILAQAGEVMLWLNAPKDAYAYYKKAALLSGGNLDYVMKLIQTASYTGDKTIFKDAAETAEKLRPYDEQVAMLVAAVWDAAGDSAKARNLLAAFASVGSKNLDMLLNWAEFADRAGLSEEAYRIYEQLYGLDYKRKKVRKELARLAGWTDRPQIAAKYWGEMSDEKPHNFSLAVQAAKGFSDSAEYKKAVVYYERARSLSPDDIELKLELAKTYGFADMNAQRIKLFNELYEAGHLPESYRIELARAFIDEKKPEAALDILEPYARLDKLPRFEGFLLAIALQQAGRGSEASAIYKRLGKEYSTDGVFLARLGAEALFNNFNSDAYSLFEAALKVNKDNHTALKGIAILLGEREQYNRAISKFRSYLRLVPDDADARYQLAEIYRLLGREANADREFRRAERIIKRRDRNDTLKANAKLTK